MLTTENEIIRRIQKGDRKSFELLFREYYARLCHYAFQYVKTHEQAEEIVQELFFQLWQKRQQLILHTSLNAYLYKAIYLNCMAWIRKQNIRLDYAQKMEKQAEPMMNEQEVEQNEINRIVLETLAKMPERVRQVFQLSRYDGLKYHEIADRLSISVKTVEANMGKALKLFRYSLKDYVGMMF